MEQKLFMIIYNEDNRDLDIKYEVEYTSGTNFNLSVFGKRLHRHAQNNGVWYFFIYKVTGNDVNILMY